MSMPWLLPCLIAFLAAIEAGYMAFDGVRALRAGDYLTPRNGPYAGQLGPWAGLVRAVGIEPRSTGMKAFFAVYGLLWLLVIAAFLARPFSRWRGVMLVAAAGTLWYAPVGTVLSLLQIALLLFTRAPASAGA